MINRLKKFFADNSKTIKTAWEWLTFGGCLAILVYMQFGDYDRMRAALEWPVNSMMILICFALISVRQEKTIEQLRNELDELKHSEKAKRAEFYQFIKHNLAAGARK